MMYEVKPGTPTNIVGAQEVWGAGGRVFVCSLEPGPDGKKYSTTWIEQQLLHADDVDWKELLDDALGG